MNQQNVSLSSTLRQSGPTDTSYKARPDWNANSDQPRLALRNFYRSYMAKHMQLYAADDLCKPALIIAPHPDDEVLGCGGTIIRKRQAGAEITVIFMTDGSNSHQHLLPRETLKQVRAEEAIAACQRLGVPADHVYFFEAPDSRLHTKISEAVEQLAALVATYHPAEIFVPYEHDPNPDHIAAAQAVNLLLAQQQHEIVCYEYPVWAWFHWPWAPLTTASKSVQKMFLGTSLREFAGLRMLHRFQIGVPIDDLLDQKWQALTKHRTQMTAYLANCQWQTLHDVADGEWLSCFFQPYELFHRRSDTERRSK
jgi:LmbE family N-acetylglucosaminyl deacetylase